MVQRVEKPRDVPGREPGRLRKFAHPIGRPNIDERADEPPRLRPPDASLASRGGRGIAVCSLRLDEERGIFEMDKRIAREVEVVHALAGKKVSCSWAQPGCDKENWDGRVERAKRAPDTSEESRDLTWAEGALGLDRERGVDARASDLNRSVGTTVARKEFRLARRLDFPVRGQPRPQPGDGLLDEVVLSNSVVCCHCESYPS